MSRRCPSLGFDPTPGSLEEARRIARTTAETSTALEEIAAVLSGAASGAWRGKAAIAFRDLLDDDFRPKVVTASKAFTAAARALQAWSDTMERSQQRARSLDGRHAEAVRRARAAAAAAAAVPAPPSGPPADTAQATQRAALLRAAADARSAVSAAESEVGALVAQARALGAEYEEEGRAAAAALTAAVDLAPQEPGFWSGLADDVSGALDRVSDVAHDVRDRVVDLLEQVAPVLSLIGEMTGLLSTTLGLLALVPGLQLLAVPALALGVVSLGTTYLGTVGATGDVSDALTDRDVVLAAVGVAAGGVSVAVAGRLVAAARTGSSTGVAGATTTKLVGQALGRPVEVPLDFFQLARSATYSMGEGEAVYRAVALHASWATGVQRVAGLPETDAAVRKVISWEFGPLTRSRPSVVR